MSGAAIIRKPPQDRGGFRWSIADDGSGVGADAAIRVSVDDLCVKVPGVCPAL